MGAAYDQMEIHEMEHRVLQKLKNSQEKRQAKFNQLADDLLEILVTLRAEKQKRSQRPQQTPTSLFIASESVGTLKATPRVFAESPPATEHAKPPSCELFGEIKESRNIALHEQGEAPEEDQPEAAANAAEEDFPGEIDNTIGPKYKELVPQAILNHDFSNYHQTLKDDHVPKIVDELMNMVPPPIPAPTRSSHYEFVRSASATTVTSPFMPISKPLPNKKFQKVAMEIQVTWDPIISPLPLEPPDRVVVSVSPRSICRADESSLKTTPGEFTPCSAAINYLLCFEKVGHAVCTCVDNVVVNSYTMLLIAFTRQRLVTYTYQVFDQMLKCNLEAWNAIIIGCKDNEHEDVAFDLLKAMHQMEIRPGNYTFSSMLSWCSLELLNNRSWLVASGYLQIIGMIQSTMCKNRLKRIEILNVWVSSHCRYRQINCAFQIFTGLIFLICLISGFLIIGCPQKWLEQFSALLKVHSFNCWSLLSASVVVLDRSTMYIDAHVRGTMLGLVNGNIGTKFTCQLGVLIADLAIDATSTIRVDICQSLRKVDHAKVCLNFSDGKHTQDAYVAAMIYHPQYPCQLKAEPMSGFCYESINCGESSDLEEKETSQLISKCQNQSWSFNYSGEFNRSYLESSDFEMRAIVYQHVAADYANRVSSGYEEAKELAAYAFVLLLNHIVNSHVIDFQQCLLLNMSYCYSSEASLANGNTILVIVYNPLDWKLGTTLLYVTSHHLSKKSLLILQLVKLVVVLHRKMINWGGVLITKFMLKWRDLPPKHGTWKFAADIDKLVVVQTIAFAQQLLSHLLFPEINFLYEVQSIASLAHKNAIGVINFCCWIIFRIGAENVVASSVSDNWGNTKAIDSVFEPRESTKSRLFGSFAMAYSRESFSHP